MKSIIYNWDLNHKRVILRIDANVPLSHGTIINDQRLAASQATINLLLDKGAQVIIICHIGRPYHQEHELSTQHLLPWFLQEGYDITFAPSIELAKKACQDGCRLILLENIRFFSEEQNPTIAFAQQLASLGNYYVNDAFGSLHRNDCSITLLPEQFDPQHTTIGLLIDHELTMLDRFFKNSQKPFALVIGGGKMQDKIPYIAQLLPKISYALIGPALCFTFLKAEGKSVGKSLINKADLGLCKDIITQAHELGVPLYYPLDYIVAENSYEGPLDIIHHDQIPEHDVGISIGPKTALVWSQKIIQAKAILLNGLMGILHRPESLTYLQELFLAMSYSNATSVIAGGDSAAAAYDFNLTRDMSYISTGGGAALAHICGNELPGLQALKNRTKSQKT